MQWKIAKKKTINGAFLKIALGPRVSLRDPLPTLPHEEAASETSSDRLDPQQTKATPSQDTLKRRRRVKSREERHKLKAAAFRRFRGPRDACLVPDRFLYRLEVGADGAMTVAFSFSGHLLAIAARTSVFNVLTNSQGTS